MTAWNPNAPELLGPEWMPVVSAAGVLGSDAACFAQTLNSTAAETINTVVVSIPTIATAGRYILEVYEAGQEIAGAVTTSTYRPNEDSAVFNVENQAAAVVNLYQSVDEAVLDTADYVENTNSTIFGNTWTYKLDTAAWAAARRVTAMRWVSVGRQVAGQHEWEFAIRKQTAGFLRVLRTAYASAAGQFTATAHLGEMNPFTGAPWLEAEIESFDSTVAADRLSLRFGLAAPVDAASVARLYQTYLEIDWVAENRVAYGVADVAAGLSVGSFTLQTPAGVDNWAKANGQAYTFVLRRIPQVGNPDDPQAGPLGTSVGNVSWAYMDDQGGGLPTAMLAASYAPTLDPGGYITTLGAALTRGFGIYMVTTGLAAGADGIYGTFGSTWVTSPPSSFTQTFTPGANHTYEAVVLVVSWGDAAVPPTSALTARIRRTSDAVQLGGDGTFTVAEFAAADKSAQGWAVATITLASAAALISGTEYELTLEGSSVDITSAWYIAVGYFAFGVSLPSWAGTTNHWATSTNGDQFALLADLPPVPPNFAAAIATQALTGDGTNCSVDSMQYVALTWTPNVNTAFSEYQIERSLDGGVTWEQIATLSDIASASFADYEGTRGVVATYRIRQVAYLLVVPSPWSASVTATPQAVGCEVLFTSNEQPALNVAYIDEGGERVYELQDSDRVVLHPIVDRDGQVALQPTEHLGDRWVMQLVVNAVTAPSVPGRTVFDELEDLSRADIPHVTVLDSDGNRWIALLQVPRVTRREPGALYVGEAIVTTLAFAPTPVTL